MSPLSPPAIKMLILQVVHRNEIWPDSPWLLLFSVQNHCFHCRTIVINAELLFFGQRGVVTRPALDVMKS